MNKKKAKCASRSKKKTLKIKDLTMGRKAGKVKGGLTATTQSPSFVVRPSSSWIIPCV
jgi:hypothetical protein